MIIKNMEVLIAILYALIPDHPD